jgi:transposase
MMRQVSCPVRRGAGRKGRKDLARSLPSFKVLGVLFLRTLRRKLPELELALTGQFTAHHGRLIQGALELIDLLERQITELDGSIGELVAPWQSPIAQLDTIPGLHETAARAI